MQACLESLRPIVPTPFDCYHSRRVMYHAHCCNAAWLELIHSACARSAVHLALRAYFHMDTEMLRRAAYIAIIHLAIFWMNRELLLSWYQAAAKALEAG